MRSKDEGRMASSIDTDQTAPSLSAQTCLSQHFGSLRKLFLDFLILMEFLIHVFDMQIFQVYLSFLMKCASTVETQKLKTMKLIMKNQETEGGAHGIVSPICKLLYAEKQESWLRREMHWKLKSCQALHIFCGSRMESQFF